VRKTPVDKIEAGVQKLIPSSPLGRSRLHVFMFMGRCRHVHSVVLKLVMRRSYYFRSSCRAASHRLLTARRRASLRDCH
jgi:hypothetical protein